MNVGNTALCDALALFAADALIHFQKRLHKLAALVNVVRLHTLGTRDLKSVFIQRLGDDALYLIARPVDREANVNACCQSGIVNAQLSQHTGHLSRDLVRKAHAYCFSAEVAVSEDLLQSVKALYSERCKRLGQRRCRVQTVFGA